MRPPEIIQGADLAPLSTFRLPARARQLLRLEHEEQIHHLGPAKGPRLVLGGGSNTLFLGDWPGQILLNRLRGIAVESLADGTVRVRAAAGENWHALVRWCLDRGLYGIENLVLIPGSVGAAPMQNIGAYGVELADVFECLQAWDLDQGERVELDREACRFGYRDSRFKSSDRDRFIITSICLKLTKNWQPKTHYRSLADELDKAGIAAPTPRQLSAAVMRLRRHRLPDPARLANAGSFFKNPIIDSDRASALIAEHPDLPHWPLSQARVKLAAGWMIERLGWKGKRIGDAGVYANHALVLVNLGQATASDLKKLIDAIIDDVDSNFGIRLEPEPALIQYRS